MNNDRELLELAAKAAGFGGPEHKFCWTEGEYPRGSGKHGALWNYIGHMDTAVLWNPLTNDGDALRLAVKLNMCVTSFSDEQMVGVLIHGEGRNFSEPPGADPYAATCRAIVRAAAEIGRQMPEGGAA